MNIRHLLKQLVGFGVIGVISALIDVLIMNGCMMAWHMANIPASAISFTISLVFNYMASMRSVFTHRDGISPWRDFIVFIGSALAGLAITAGIIGASTLGVSMVSHDYIIRTNIGKVIAIIIVATWNFIIRKTLIDAPDADTGRTRGTGSDEAGLTREPPAIDTTGIMSDPRAYLAQTRLRAGNDIDHRVAR